MSQGQGDNPAGGTSSSLIAEIKSALVPEISALISQQLSNLRDTDHGSQKMGNSNLLTGKPPGENDDLFGGAYPAVNSVEGTCHNIPS